MSPLHIISHDEEDEEDVSDDVVRNAELTCQITVIEANTYNKHNQQVLQVIIGISWVS